MERNWEGREEIKSALGQSAESCSQCVCWHWREYRIPWWCTKLELLNFFLHSLSLLVSEICFWLFTGSVFPPFITCILFAAKIMCLKVKKTKGGWWQASCFFIIFREWLMFAKYVTHSCILQSWNLCSWESNNNNKKCCLVDNKLWVGCGLCGCPPGFLHQKSYPWSLVVIRDACQPQLITLDVLGSLLVQMCVRIWCALLVFVIRWESSSYVFPCIYFCGSISWRSVSQKPSACGRQLISSSLLRVGQNAEYLNPLSPSEVFIGGKAFMNVLLRLI